MTICYLNIKGETGKQNQNKASDLKLRLLSPSMEIHSKTTIPADDDIALIIKYHDPTLIRKYRKTVFELVDVAWKANTLNAYINRVVSISKYHNHLIVNSGHLKSLLTRKVKIPISINYHEHDMRLEYNTSNHVAKVFYIGSTLKTDFKPDDMRRFGITHIAGYTEKSFTNQELKGVHIDYVKPYSVLYHMHTSTKLSTAMVLDSVFVSNRIPIFVELLGDDYPYFFKDDLSDCQQVIDNALDVVKDQSTLKMYLRSLENVQKRLSPDTIRSNYVDIMKSV